VGANGVAGTGKVLIFAGSVEVEATLVNGVATATLPALPPGTYTVKAYYPGSTGIGSKIFTLGKLTVAKHVAKVTPKLAKKTVKTSAKAKVTVTVANAKLRPTGKVAVTVYKGKTKVKTVTATLAASGKKTVKLPKLPKGTYKVKVKYAGDANHAAKTAAKTLKLKVK
jgi:hypothetical protein